MIFGERNFQLSTTVFHYGLTPYELAVYSYLASCASTTISGKVCFLSFGRH